VVIEHNSKISAGKIEELVTREIARKKSVFSITYIYGGEGGLYCSSLHNSFSFSHFTRNTCIF